MNQPFSTLCRALSFALFLPLASAMPACGDAGDEAGSPPGGGVVSVEQSTATVSKVEFVISYQSPRPSQKAAVEVDYEILSGGTKLASGKANVPKNPNQGGVDLFFKSQPQQVAIRVTRGEKLTISLDPTHQLSSAVDIYKTKTLTVE